MNNAKLACNTDCNGHLVQPGISFLHIKQRSGLLQADKLYFAGTWGTD